MRTSRCFGIIQVYNNTTYLHNLLVGVEKSMTIHTHKYTISVVTHISVPARRVNTLLKIFNEADFQSHIFRNILGKILPDGSLV